MVDAHSVTCQLFLTEVYIVDETLLIVKNIILIWKGQVFGIFVTVFQVRKTKIHAQLRIYVRSTNFSFNNSVQATFTRCYLSVTICKFYVIEFSTYVIE